MIRAPEVKLEPFFLESPRGRLFCLHLAPARTESGPAVLYLHPFAEEMHKSRRMAALQARAFASRGQSVLMLDLAGCGDSWGDFGDASWSQWRQDARLAHQWLRQRAGGPVSLWGLRTGALLAADLARDLPDLERLILWQPITSGEQFLTQFLRIKLASEMLADVQGGAGVKRLRQQLEAGEGVEVGGNMLSPAMARELASLKLADLVPPRPALWLEVGAQAGDTAPPASQRVLDAWREQGASVGYRGVAGDPFWTTQYIVECPALIEATLEETARA